MTHSRHLQQAGRAGAATLVGASLCLATAGCRVFEPIRRKFRKKPPVVLDSREIVPAPYVKPQPPPPPKPKPAVAVAPRPTTKPKPKPAAPPKPRPTPPPKPVPLPKVEPEPPLMPPTPRAAEPKPAPPVTRIVKPKPLPEPEPLPEVKPTESKPLTYKVKKGDTLWDIGRMYGLGISELAAANTMNPKDVLAIGRVLTLPAGAKFVPEKNRPEIKPKPRKKPKPLKIARKPVPASGVHVVRKGDSLWLLSMTYGVPVAKLKAINGLTSNRLMPKQIIKLTGPAAAPTPAPTVPAAAAPPGAGKKPTDVDVSITVVPETGNVQTPSAAAGGTTTTTTKAPVRLKELPHFVVEGDTLQGIADMYGSKVDWIKAHNPTLKGDADLKAGDKIVVPVEDFD